MAHRLGRLLGLVALVLVLVRLGRVLEVTVDTPDWRLMAVAGAVGGTLVMWMSARLSPWRRLLVHAAAVTLFVGRVVSPDTLIMGILPGPETAVVVGQELGFAVEILRFGAPPVLAVAGLAALTSVAMWVLGALWAWSAAGGATWAAILPALGFYLYLAVVDRADPTPIWAVTFAALLALALVVTGNVVPAGAGRLRAGDHRPLPRWQLSPAMGVATTVALVGLVGATALGSVVPAGGAVQWRHPGGEGSGLGSGGFSASRFAGLRQSIVSLSDDPVFVASVTPPTEGGPLGYWRLLTLDHFDGEQWRVGDADFTLIDEAEAELAPRTVSTTQTIEIRSLRDDRLPSLLTPVAVTSEEPVVRSGTSLGRDGSLQLNARTFEGLRYRVESEVPRLDLGALASRDGALTPMFEEAAREGSFGEAPVEVADLPRPEVVASFLDLPDSTDPAIAAIARRSTRGASTPFEAALLLEDFLRGFTYSTDVTTGHSSLELVAWLDDPESRNYRTGYCEQFATGMAVLARTLGIPSRVVIGFTTGEVIDTADGPLTVVRENNAHAWVELWIDGHGWVGFDPTPRTDGATSPMAETVGFDPGSVDLPVPTGDAALEGLDQPGFIEGLPNIPVADLLGDTSGPVSSGAPWWLPLLAAVALALAVVPSIKTLRTRQRRRRSAGGDIVAAWEEIVDRLTDLDLGPERHATPVEFACATERALLPLARAYSAAIYGQRPTADAAAHLQTAERWIEESFDGSRRARAAFSLRSLRRDNGPREHRGNGSG